MGLRFWRRKKIAPGVTLNLSKSGVSVSVGPPGAKVTVGPKGTRSTVGIPGSGLHYTRSRGHRTSGNGGLVLGIVAVIIPVFFVIGGAGGLIFMVALALLAAP